MEFLVAVVALMVIYLHGPVEALHGDQRYLGWLANINSAPTISSIVIKLLVPAIVVAIALVFFSRQGSFMVFCLNLVLLLFCFGRGDIDAKIDALIADFKDGDTQAAFHDLEELEYENSVGNVTTKGEFHNALLQSVSYRLFEYVFPTLFWFFILGAPGAILYRTAVLLAENSNGQQGAQQSGYVLMILEWLPVRLLGLSFAVVGNFGSCIKHWQEYFFDTTRSSAEVIAHCVEGAIDVDPQVIGVEEGADEMASVKNLFHRSLIFGLSIFAVLDML